LTRDELGILVLEDVPLVRNQIAELLVQFGFKNILMCSSVADARPILETQAIHLILSDWHLGTPSGLDFLREVRSHPKWKSLPFIFITAEATKERIIEALKIGIDDYLIKPLTADQIQNKVYGVLIKKKLLS
jgi:two-component system chemotaxis response regulator CheY